MVPDMADTPRVVPPVVNDLRVNLYVRTGADDACAPMMAEDGYKSFASWIRALVETQMRDRNPEAYKAMKGVA